MLRIELSEAEVAEVREAAARVTQEKSAGSRRYADERTDLAVGVMGFGGEVAAAKWLGVPYDLSVKREGFSGPDLYSRRGNGVEVKTVGKPHYRLLLNAGRSAPHEKVDVLVLVVRESERVFFVKGWIWTGDFVNRREELSVREGGVRWGVSDRWLTMVRGREEAA